MLTHRRKRSPAWWRAIPVGSLTQAAVEIRPFLIGREAGGIARAIAHADRAGVQETVVTEAADYILEGIRFRLDSGALTSSPRGCIVRGIASCGSEQGSAVVADGNEPEEA